MKKRVICLSLAVLLLLCLLSGCSSRKGDVDYSREENWAYAEKDQTEKRADVFFLCPTVYSGGLNMPMDDKTGRESFLGATNMEKGIYEEECRIFAPYYSQAGLEIYMMTGPEQQEPSLTRAYEYAADAFMYYMKHENHGRPLILAGFSQGADMCIRLLKEYGDEKALQDVLVACYAIGWTVTEEEQKKFPQLKTAAGEDDTGVIISFNTEAEDVGASFVVPEGEKTLAINPLNWKTDSTPADKALNKGACFTDYSGQAIREIPALTGAYIDPARGTLKVPDIDPGEYPAQLPFCQAGVYHIYDYQFFFRNLQENVTVRLDAFLKKS